jgi:hypothetical protein
MCIGCLPVGRLPSYGATVRGGKKRVMAWKRELTRVAKAMARAMRVVGDKEGKGIKGDGNGNECGG